MAENPRTETARDHDDSDLIDGMIPDASAGGTSGGQLAVDVGTQNDLDRAVADPDAHQRVAKSNDIAHDQARTADRGPDR
jgi:hypothetical protein